MNNNNNNNLISPVKSYVNAELFKEAVLKDNSGKAGIYRWVNNLNKKTYVGSGVNLAKRFEFYFLVRKERTNLKIRERGRSHIYNALLKYGYSATVRAPGTLT